MFLLALAIAPGLAICIYVFYRDVYDREPALNLILSFAWGMLATLPAVTLELLTQQWTDKSVAGIIFSSFFLIALAEEGTKSLALRYYSFRRRSFDEPLDGIVYGIMVSMGFATIENIAFVLKSGAPAAFIRIFTAVPAHACFGVIMGYYVGKAKFDLARRNQLLFRGLLAATLAHGFYDAFLFLNQNNWIHRYISATVAGLLFFAGAIASLAISLVFGLRLVRLHRQTSSKLYAAAPALTIRLAGESDLELIRMLARQVWPQTYAGVLSPQQIRYMMQLMYNEETLRKQMKEHIQFIIVYNAGVPIGFAAYGPIGHDTYKLHKIYLMQKQQGRGSGRFVIGQIISDIRPKGAVALQLNVNRHNPAKAFYEKLGFEVIRDEDIDIGNGFFMNDFVMEKSLTDQAEA